MLQLLAKSLLLRTSLNPEVSDVLHMTFLTFKRSSLASVLFAFVRHSRRSIGTRTLRFTAYDEASLHDNEVGFIA